MTTRFWLIEVEVDSKPSVMNEIMRGRVPTGPIRGNLHARRVETEQCLVVAENRDEAIAKFRRVTGCGKRLDSVRPVRKEQARHLLHDVAQSRHLPRIGELTSEVEESLRAASAPADPE
jgi:hypothetical protein